MSSRLFLRPYEYHHNSLILIWIIFFLSHITKSNDNNILTERHLMILMTNVFRILIVCSLYGIWPDNLLKCLLYFHEKKTFIIYRFGNANKFKNEKISYSRCIPKPHFAKDVICACYIVKPYNWKVETDTDIAVFLSSNSKINILHSRHQFEILASGKFFLNVLFMGY